VAIWDELSDSQREMFKLGDDAVARLESIEPLETWYQTGMACEGLQQAALVYAGANSTSNTKYRKAWLELGKHLPRLVALDKGERSHAIWLAQNWPTVEAWLAVQASNVRRRLNHPRSVRRKYESSQIPPPPDGQEKEPTARVKMQDQITKLTEERGPQFEDLWHHAAWDVGG
jgi:hypothetical protein